MHYSIYPTKDTWISSGSRKTDGASLTEQNFGKDEILELLTVAFESGAVTLVFSGSAAVKLEGEAIVCFLEDLAAPRPCGFSPRHPMRPVQ